MRQFTKEEAIEFANDKKYIGLTDIEIAHLQINNELLCMPFDVFHEAIEKVLRRPIFTHEFGFSDSVTRMREEVNALYAAKEEST